jgi:hypothetical protein
VKDYVPLRKTVALPGKYLFNFYQGIFPLKINTLTFSPVKLRWYGLKSIFLIKKYFISNSV